MLSLLFALFCGIAGMNGTPGAPIVEDNCLGGAQGSLICMDAIVTDEGGGGGNEGGTR